MITKTPSETANLAELYGARPVPWARAVEAIGSGSFGPEPPCFLGTVRPDGRPHSAGVGVAEHAGYLHIVTGPGTRKARNLAHNPACTLSMRLPGIDLVLECEAQRVTDHDTLVAVAATYAAGGWPAEADLDADALTAPYSAQSAGPPPWHLYRLEIQTVFGLELREPHGASRWRF